MQKQLLAVLAIATMFACNSMTNNADITGTYIHHAADETGQLWDTIEISALNADENLYTVIKKSGIQNIRDGKDTLPIENKSSTYTATYNKSSNNFHIMELAANYTVDVSNNTIKNNLVQFKKIDQKE